VPGAAEDRSGIACCDLRRRVCQLLELVLQQPFSCANHRAAVLGTAELTVALDGDLSTSWPAAARWVSNVWFSGSTTRITAPGERSSQAA
jgi:hypothetical protein